MKKILFLTEKPSLFKSIYQKAKEAKDPFFLDSEIHLVFCHSGTAPTYDYPKDVKYKDYPKVSPLKLKWSAGYENWNEKNDFFESYENVKAVKSRPEFLEGYDCLVVATDPDNMGAFYSKSLLEFVYGFDYEKRFGEVYYTRFMEYENIYKELFEDSESKKRHYMGLARAGEFKKWFQYNFNFNSSIFFSEVLAHLGIKSDIKMSKYMLLLMHLFYNPKYTNLIGGSFEKFFTEGIHEAEVLDAMQKYKGSGKYEFDWDSRIGTPATIASILDNLYRLGLLGYDKKRYHVLPTSLGESFFFLLNKRTFDIDQPKRLNLWLERVFEGEDPSSEVEEYIVSFFAGQKRKNNKTLRGWVLAYHSSTARTSR